MTTPNDEVSNQVPNDVKKKEMSSADALDLIYQSFIQNCRWFANGLGQGADINLVNGFIAKYISDRLASQAQPVSKQETIENIPDSKI